MTIYRKVFFSKKIFRATISFTQENHHFDGVTLSGYYPEYFQIIKIYKNIYKIVPKCIEIYQNTYFLCCFLRFTKCLNGKSLFIVTPLGSFEMKIKCVA